MAKKHWIAGAIKHPGALRNAAARAGMSTSAFAHKHAGDSGVEGRRARLALTLMKMHHGGRGHHEHELHSHASKMASHHHKGNRG